MLVGPLLGRGAPRCFMKKWVIRFCCGWPMIPVSGWLPAVYPRAREAREAPGGGLFEAESDESKKVVNQVEIVSDTHDR